MGRVLAIGLDGYEESFARQLMDAGEMPRMESLRRRSAGFLLDHGPAQRTGLAWEHVSSGLSPDKAGRWAAVHFDPVNYACWQQGTSLTPFPAGIASRTVVFDPPYFDLHRAPAVQGIVNWGAHDPGIPPGARPECLLGECRDRFGSYPAAQWIYGFVWPSASRTAEMGAALADAVDLRSRAAQWLLRERLPEWDLGMVVVSEPHSAIEALWHGVDPGHPLHQLPSAPAAREGMLAVYRAVDRLIGQLADAFPDARLAVFSMGGMGPNRSDVASMVLLPELMYRMSFSKPLLQQPAAWPGMEDGYPLVDGKARWSESIIANLARPPVGITRRVASAVLPPRVKALLRRGASSRARGADARALLSLDWMPAAHYQRYWSEMEAFALPSFYDGRIRINLAGRERNGRVSIKRYPQVCSSIESLLLECRDLLTGESVVDFIERPKSHSPLDLGPTESDMIVVWKGCSAGFVHPRLGTIGPVPLRRTGGHTGPYGMAYLAGDGIQPGYRGVQSSFDVVPTLISMLGEITPPALSGRNLLA